MRDLEPYRLIDARFARHRRSYILQAVLAATVLGLVLTIADSLSDAAIITGIASSAFIIFMTPHSHMAVPRRVFGGHFVAVLIGLSAGALLHGPLGQSYETNTLANIVAAVGVGLGMLAMSVTETEHPPAAGTILGLAMGEHALEMGVLVLSMAAGLCLARQLLSRWLIDLIEAPAIDK